GQDAFPHAVRPGIRKAHGRVQRLPCDDRPFVRRHQAARRIGLSQSGLRAEAIMPGDGAAKQRRRDRSTAVTCLVAILCCLCTPPRALAQGIPLRYAQAYSSLRSIFALPLLVAEREGYFLREGLNFSMVPVPGGGERLVEVLHEGSADICHVAT